MRCFFMKYPYVSCDWQGRLSFFDKKVFFLVCNRIIYKFAMY